MASDDLKIRSLNEVEAHSSISSKLPYLDERCWQQLLAKEITPKDIDSARKVAKALHGLKAAGDKDIGDQVILDAEMRQLAVESIYSNALYVTPSTVDIRNKLAELDDRVLNMENKLRRDHWQDGDAGCEVRKKMAQAQAAADKAQATADNIHIIYLNHHLPYPYEFLPLKKMTPGSGYDLARDVCKMDLDNQVDKDRLPKMSADSDPPKVGSLPCHESFNGQIMTYSHSKIREMIIFYNDNFGIICTDSLSERIDKFRSFLSDFRKQ
ncbi:hypothetical protein ARMGADRAFT_1142229 [Armillaria gallica]|uniref:Uncharacterized protein n=1 Tax=Armillaria gallica TaxID=47427 RepID=A0A2H3DKU5_ARMGA|nr:hypothetical protein ARMGADRAFT_1142229 [Armillaria gallica]